MLGNLTEAIRVASVAGVLLLAMLSVFFSSGCAFTDADRMASADAAARPTGSQSSADCTISEVLDRRFEAPDYAGEGDLRLCRQEGPPGVRVHVLWPDGDSRRGLCYTLLRDGAGVASLRAEIPGRREASVGPYGNECVLMGLSQPGIDRLVLPAELESGTYQICNSRSRGSCSDFEITEKGR